MSVLCHTQRIERLTAGWLAVTLLAGCREPADSPTQPPVPAAAASTNEPTLAQQAQAVERGQSDTIRLDQTLVRDGDLAALDPVSSRVRRVNLSRTEITDAGLARLCDLSELQQLRLASGNVTDAGLAHVARLEHLRFLHLLDAPITDQGLIALHGLTGLESLYLDRTRVTDAGLARLLAALPKVHLHIDEHHHPLDPRGKEHAH